MSKPCTAIALALSLVLSTGCATTLSIRSMQPGVVHVGSTNHMVLIDGQGRRSAREFVAHELTNQSRARGYFSVEDRSEEGFSVRVAGRTASIEGGDFQLEADQAGLRVDVLEWGAQRDEDEVKVTDSEGNTRIRRVPVLRGNVLLAITLFDQSGRAFLSESEYEGWSTCEPSALREETIEKAARAAIHSFLNDVTPVQIVTRVRLDDEDEGQETFIATAKAGGVAQAAQDLEAYLQQNPRNPSAAYNLAVLLEAMGDFEAALEMYDRALSLGGKDYYGGARAGCASRLRSDQALR